jgi:hypothetical protein
MAVSSIHNGWRWDSANSRLDFYYRGTRVGHINATGLSGALALSAATTVTGGTGVTATTGNVAATAGSFVAPTGNVSLGNPGAFATTQPQGAVVMGGTSLSGIAPAGAIATAGGVFASDTVVRKIIANGTVSNVET